MARQMRTHETHYTTEDFKVVTQTGFVNGKRVYEIAVVNLNTGREEFQNVESVEKAVTLCDKRQAEREKLRAEVATKRETEAQAEAKNTNEEVTEKVEARGPLATDRQVDYIMSLLAQHGGQNTTWFSQGPTTLKEVSRMTRRDASTYISALKGDN